MTDDDFKEQRLAQQIAEALQDSSADAMQACFVFAEDNDLSGVTIDGHFDLIKVSRILLGHPVHRFPALAAPLDLRSDEPQGWESLGIVDTDSPTRGQRIQGKIEPQK